jgi:hypothetical protein
VSSKLLRICDGDGEPQEIRVTAEQLVHSLSSVPASRGREGSMNTIRVGTVHGFRLLQAHGSFGLYAKTYGPAYQTCSSLVRRKRLPQATRRLIGAQRIGGNLNEAPLSANEK